MADELLQKDITDTVNNRIQQLQSEGLQLPASYNAANALKSAWFALQKVETKDHKSALGFVDPKSVANALLDMVTQGLSPAKTQVYFVAYGKDMTMMRSYFGTQAVLKRLSDIDDVWAEVVHQDDEFEIGSEHGRTIVTKFKPSFANQDKPLVGAFAAIERADGQVLYTVMTKKEIEMAWSHRRNSGKVQQEFPQEMAKRTVINRAAKNLINTSDDSDLLIDAINRTTHDEYENDSKSRKDVTPETTNVKDFLNAPKQGKNKPKPVTKKKETTNDLTAKEVKNDVKTDRVDHKPVKSKTNAERAQETDLFKDTDTAPF
ncbi:recombinase RecT [Agrilactobacillus fermenti]|uniref:recombinase RecT n=1 Tax=Agrilactobacillus fermenti TaxID=2586909 RepID=UPI003A5B9EB9